ncbi:MAG: MarR family winged helix-turn-helix transcriptional regulator [Gemmatimonadaceae bacterium]
MHGLQYNPALSDTAGVSGALDAIRRLVRTLRTSANEIERDTGLTSAQNFVLQLLSQAPAESMNELAARTMTDQSSVSVVVSRLEAKGLVTRAQSAADARRTRVEVTPAGRELLDGKQPTVQARLIRALESMSPDALVLLEYQLTELTALMGAAHEPATLFFEDDATGSP